MLNARIVKITTITPDDFMLPYTHFKAEFEQENGEWSGLSLDAKPVKLQHGGTLPSAKAAVSLLVRYAKPNRQAIRITESYPVAIERLTPHKCQD